MTTLAQLDAALHAAPLVAQWSCYHHVGADVLDEVKLAARRRGWRAETHDDGPSLTVDIPNSFGGSPYRVTLWA